MENVSKRMIHIWIPRENNLRIVKPVLTSKNVVKYDPLKRIFLGRFSYVETELSTKGKQLLKNLQVLASPIQNRKFFASTCKYLQVPYKTASFSQVLASF